MKIRSLITLALVLATALASFSLLTLATPASANIGPADSISFTMTTTTNYPMTTAGALQVSFDSVQLTSPPPQAYSFGISAKTTPGSWITRLLWQFGDGAVMDVPYCCQSQVSEVQYHAYAQPGSYNVLVIAFDNVGNSGNAQVTVNWVTPVPEYPNYSLPLIASLIVALVAASSLRRRIRRAPIPSFS